MNVNIQREIDYTSKCFPDVKMKLKNMSSSDMEKSYKRIRSNMNSKKKNTGEMKIEWDMDFIFKCMVFDIKNLSITDENDKVIEIKTGKDILYNPGLDELYLELSAVLLTMTARVDAKN